MTNKKKDELQIAKEYDELPYSSYPFEYNRPENLRSIAAIFNYEAAPLEKARVLELGCASGGNLIRFAMDYPKSYTLGIDISEKQIEVGQKQIKELKIKNLELKHLSITDLDDSYGKFDYIICHGVFSWVPENVREAILEIGNKLLSKNGLMFVSYNTLPGWNMISTIRDFMIYHASNFIEINDKVQQSKAAINFLNQSLEGKDSAHARFMQESAKGLLDKEDHYLRHEYLASENKAFYFYEFIDLVKEHSLDYLGDSDLHRMFVGNLPKSAAEKLATINDLIRTEQYIDFIKNTQFRCTILCRPGANIARNITMDVVRKLYFCCYLKASKEMDLSKITDNEEILFYLDETNTANIAARTPAIKAILYSFANNIGRAMSVDDLISESLKIYNNKTEIEQEMANSLGRMIFSGYFKIFADKPKSVYEISDKPSVSDLALHQAKSFSENRKNWFTNQNNQMIGLSIHQMYILPLLNGKNTIAEIKEEIFKVINSGKLVANQGDQKIEDQKLQKDIANSVVDNFLHDLKINFALIA